MGYHYITEAEHAVFFLIVVPMVIGAVCGWLACNFLGGKTFSANYTPKEHNIFWAVMAAVSVIMILPVFYTVCNPPDESTAPGTLSIRAIGAVLVFVLARAALFVRQSIGFGSPDFAVSVFARAFIGAFILVFGAILLVFADQTAAYIGESCSFRITTVTEESTESYKAAFLSVAAAGAAFLLLAAISKPGDKLLQTAEMVAVAAVFTCSFTLAIIYYWF